MIEEKELEEFLDKNFKYIPIEGYKITGIDHRVRHSDIICMGSEDECLKTKTERVLKSYRVHMINDNQYILIK